MGQLGIPDHGRATASSIQLETRVDAKPNQKDKANGAGSWENFTDKTQMTTLVGNVRPTANQY